MKKIIKLAGLCAVVFFMPLVLAARLLRPLLWIRFGLIRSGRIGHLAGNVDLYLSYKETDKSFKKFDIFFLDEKVCNEFLWKVCRRKLRIHPLVKWLYKANQAIPQGEPHTVNEILDDRDLKGVLYKAPTAITFTEQEKQEGEKQIIQLGVPANAKLVCFCGRDSAYLNAAYPNQDWSYHDFRDSRIENYLPAIEEMAGRGYYAVRMGSVVKDRLPVKSPKIIDYPLSGKRSDFLDIFLSAKCQFFIGCSAGIMAVPRALRKPVAFVDFISIEHAITWMPQDLFIPKKLWLKSEKRFLTFKEILNSGAGRFGRAEQFTKLGLEPVDNTPGEIKDLVTEMDDRLNGCWQATPEDRDLQQRFLALFKPNDLNGVFFFRIGAKFLRENRNLLN